MPEKPKDINELLGNLRRRTTELMHGDYSRGFKDELSAVKIYIEFFSPDEIIANLKPIYDNLASIDEDIFDLVSDDLYNLIGYDDIPERNLTGESSRDRMKKEVENYLNGLEFYLMKYANPSSLSSEHNRYREIKIKPTILTYSKFKTPSGRQNLENLRIALLNNRLIANLSLRDFKKIFSGTEQKILNPINWQDDQNSLKYFLQELFKNETIAGDRRIHWMAVKNCFLYKGKPIDEKFKRNSTKPANYKLIDRILSNLKPVIIPKKD